VLGNNGDHQQGQHNGILHDDVEGKIFVGGLSWQTTEESMRFHFEKFGELSDIAIMIDKRTGQPRYFPHIFTGYTLLSYLISPVFFNMQRFRVHYYERSCR
jgi:RNA recognition motif. (a.k.a. RRM, RBD, or RNP domain)